MKKGTLHLVHRQLAAPVVPPPEYALRWDSLKGSLQIEFRVIGRVPHVNPALPDDRSAERLWEHDVVEAFISLASNEAEVLTAPYLEFQVSPLGQFFELRILEPRKKVESTPLGLKLQASIYPDSWTACMEIPLQEHFKNGVPQSLFGNLYAIFGASGGREFWSLYTPPQEIPDFHIPAHFKRLLILD